MTHPARNLITLAIVPVTLLLSGCSKQPDAPAPPHHADDGHDHSGHSHPHEPADHHSNERSLGSFTLAGTTLNLAITGDLKPSAVLHVHIEHASGPHPTAIRVWIGDESAAGSIKSKAAREGDNTYHADAEAPADVSPTSALWLEIESADGSRTAGSLPLTE